MRPHLNGKKLDVVVHACHLSKGGKHKTGRSWSRSAWSKSETPSKITRAKRAGGMAQAVKHLPSKL
jgi:hypothetical protein